MVWMQCQKMWMSKKIIACMARDKSAFILEVAKEGFGHDRSSIQMSLHRRCRKNKAITIQPENCEMTGRKCKDNDWLLHAR